MKHLFAVIIVLTLQGCASTTYWVKQGGNQQEFNQTQAGCNNQAYGIPQQRTDVRSPPNYQVTLNRAYGSNLVTGSVTPYQAPYQALGDGLVNLGAALDNIIQREMYIENCMVANGWLKTSKAQMALSVSAHARVGTDDNLYEGTATGYPDHTGTISMNNKKNNACTGTFRYVTQSYGDGIVRCDDGDSFEFRFTALTTMSGHGSGVSEKGVPFRFVYGLKDEQRKQYLDQ